MSIINSLHSTRTAVHIYIPHNVDERRFAYIRHANDQHFCALPTDKCLKQWVVWRVRNTHEEVGTGERPLLTWG